LTLDLLLLTLLLAPVREAAPALRRSNAETVLKVGDAALLGRAGPKQRRQLLDVGCGDGLLIDLAERRGFEATGLEPDAQIVHLAGRRGLDATFVAAGACDDEATSALEAKRYDVVVFNHLIEHIDALAEVIERCRSWLAPGGVTSRPPCATGSPATACPTCSPPTAESGPEHPTRAIALRGLSDRLAADRSLEGRSTGPCRRPDRGLGRGSIISPKASQRSLGLPVFTRKRAGLADRFVIPSVSFVRTETDRFWIAGSCFVWHPAKRPATGGAQASGVPPDYTKRQTSPLTTGLTNDDRTPNQNW
jgi:SAM-dependent methyltransferase